MGNTLTDFESAVAGEPVIDADPAIGMFFGRARTFEEFIERGLRNHVGTRPAHPVHLEWRQIILIAEFVHEVNIDQPI